MISMFPFRIISCMIPDLFMAPSSGQNVNLSNTLVYGQIPTTQMAMQSSSAALCVCLISNS